MAADRVLIAFASQAGSTATIAESISAVLRRYGLQVESRAARDVADVTPYSAVILGSGMYVPSRHADGGGFLSRHATDLAPRKVWLYCAGPIGRRRCVDGSHADDAGECAVMAVAKDVGARGWAVFGPRAVDSGADLVEHLGPVDLARVRAWAAEIGEVLAPPSRAVRPAPEPDGGAPGAPGGELAERDGEPAAPEGERAPGSPAPAAGERTPAGRARDAWQAVTHS